MSSAGQFNVTAAGALVLGGIAAVILALAVALGGYGHGAKAKANASSAGGVLETEVEYPLDSDTGEPTKPAEPLRR